MGRRGFYREPPSQRPGGDGGQARKEEGEARAKKEEAVLSVESCVRTRTSAEQCVTVSQEAGKLPLADFSSGPRPAPAADVTGAGAGPRGAGGGAAESPPAALPGLRRPLPARTLRARAFKSAPSTGLPNLLGRGGLRNAKPLRGAERGLERSTYTEVLGDGVREMNGLPRVRSRSPRGPWAPRETPLVGLEASVGVRAAAATSRPVWSLSA